METKGMRELRNDFGAQLHEYMIKSDVMASALHRLLDDQSVKMDDVIRSIARDALNDFYKARG